VPLKRSCSAWYPFDRRAGAKSTATNTATVIDSSVLIEISGGARRMTARTINTMTCAGTANASARRIPWRIPGAT
jgi:hypothetical protein